MLPELSVEAVMAAMKHVGAVVGVELHRLAIEHELRIGDAVGVASDRRAEEFALGEIFRRTSSWPSTMSSQLPVRGRAHQRMQHRAKGDDARPQNLSRRAARCARPRGHPACVPKDTRSQRVACCCSSCSVLESFDDAPPAEQERVRHELQRREVDVAPAFRCQFDKTAIERRIFLLHRSTSTLSPSLILRAAAGQASAGRDRSRRGCPRSAGRSGGNRTRP